MIESSLRLRDGRNLAHDLPAFSPAEIAFVLGAIALWVGIAGLLPTWAAWLFPALCALTVWTIVRRVRNGLHEAR